MIDPARKRYFMHEVMAHGSEDPKLHCLHSYNGVLYATNGHIAASVPWQEPFDPMLRDPGSFKPTHVADELLGDPYARVPYLTWQLVDKIHKAMDADELVSEVFTFVSLVDAFASDRNVPRMKFFGEWFGIQLVFRAWPSPGATCNVSLSKVAWGARHLIIEHDDVRAVVAAMKVTGNAQDKK